VIRTVEPTQRQFGEVDAAFASDEGVGDRTLAFWQRPHHDYFGRQAALGRRMLWCERFRLAARLDTDAAPDLTRAGLEADNKKD